MPLTTDGVFLISKPAEWDAVSSATAVDIVTVLQHLGPSSVVEIADAIGLRPTALYHHLARFERLGMVRLVGKRKSTSGPPKAVYELVSPNVRTSFDASTGRNLDRAKRLFVLSFRSMERLVARAFDARLLDLGTDGQSAGNWTVGVHRARLDEDSIVEIRSLTRRIEAIIDRSRGGRTGRRWAVMTVSVPVAEKGAKKPTTRRSKDAR